MSTYGDDVRDVANATAMGGYTAMAALATSLEGISGDITPETVTATIKAMTQQELPGGGRCHVPVQRLRRGLPASRVLQPVATDPTRR